MTSYTHGQFHPAVGIEWPKTILQIQAAISPVKTQFQIPAGTPLNPSAIQ